MQQLHPARLKEPFLFPQITSDQFDEALANAAGDNVNSMIDLHAAVAGCVDALKAEGMLCEAALITIKAYVRHAASVQRGRNPEGDIWAAELLMEKIARWSITEFYKEK
jgi:hypothetical protein